ncbi:lasso peptide biosynthesis B2 protein [Mycobacterium sp. C31M]
MSPPRLYCDPALRWVGLSRRLVLLDLASGTYDMLDEVGAAMWQQLLREPEQRNLLGLADGYGVSLSIIENDFIEFADAQHLAGRLRPTPPRTVPPRPMAPRHRATMSRALRERAAAQRDLRRDFAQAYRKRTGAVADESAPRVDIDAALERFRTADGLFPAREAPLDCLPRSLALTRFLRMAGWPAEHVIGVALHPFEAHAWVELNGVAVDENVPALQRYTTIARG